VRIFLVESEKSMRKKEKRDDGGKDTGHKPIWVLLWTTKREQNERGNGGKKMGPFVGRKSERRTI